MIPSLERDLISEERREYPKLSDLIARFASHRRAWDCFVGIAYPAAVTAFATILLMALCFVGQAQETTQLQATIASMKEKQKPYEELANAVFGAPANGNWIMTGHGASLSLAKCYAVRLRDPL